MTKFGILEIHTERDLIWVVKYIYTASSSEDIEFLKDLGLESKICEKIAENPMILRDKSADVTEMWHFLVF